MSDHGHVQSICTKPHHDEPYGCMICNLFHCEVCDGFEGTLPTQCPGTKMSEEDAQLVYKSVLDFRDGKWVRRPFESWEKIDVWAAFIVDVAAKRLNAEREENHGSNENRLSL